MATLIPTTATNSFDSAGKCWLAEGLGPMRSDYSLWHTVRVGPKQPVSCGREGQAAIVIKLPALREETFAIADHLASANKKGFAWGDMALLCADWKTMGLYESALTQCKLPHRVRKRNGDYHPGADAIQVMTMKVSKGLKFSVVALSGVRHMPLPDEEEKEATRVFYVVATRATQRLVIAISGAGGFSKKLA